MKKLFVGDRGLYAVVTVLLLLSLIAVFSTLSFNEIVGKTGFSVYLVKQLVFIFAGLVVIFIAERINYKSKLFKYGTLFLFVLSLVLLIVLIVSGNEVYDAKRNLSIGGLTFQPIEILKVTFIFYLCLMLDKGYSLVNSSLKYFALYVCLPVCVVCGLVMTQKVSTSLIIFFVTLILLFVMKVNWKYLLGLIGVVIVCGCIGLAVDSMVYNSSVKSGTTTFSSRAATTGLSRIKDFLNDKKGVAIDDPTSAIGDGGLFGTFPGNSKVKFFLKNSQSDYIYSILVEEGGLVWGVFIILVYLILMFRIVIIALRCEDKYGKALSFGLGFVIVFQAFIHICVAVGLLPKTGEQLPFVSRGGTSLLMVCLTVGILQNIASQNVIKSEEEVINDEN